MHLCKDARAGGVWSRKNFGTMVRQQRIEDWVRVRCARGTEGQQEIVERIAELEQKVDISVPLVAESAADIPPAVPQVPTPVDFERLVGEVIVFRTRLGWELGTVDGLAPDGWLRVYAWPCPHPRDGKPVLKIVRPDAVEGELFGTRWQSDRGDIVRFGSVAITGYQGGEAIRALAPIGKGPIVPLAEFLSRWQKEEQS